MPGSVFDLHIHTIHGATDSNLKPLDLARVAKRVGLDGVMVTEHDRLWTAEQLSSFRQRHPLFIANGMEVSTELGHILVYGLKKYTGGIHRADDLRRAVIEAGGYMIAAHPFRHYFSRVYWVSQGSEPFDMTPEQAATLPVFDIVDAVEVLNGANNEQENAFALQVARILGKPGVGGSDAHSDQGIGAFCTIFEKAIESEDEFLRELRAGRFYPAQGLLQGDLRPYGV